MTGPSRRESDSGVVLVTERLVLRRATAGDARFVLQLLNDPDFLEHIGDREVRTEEQARLYVHQRMLASYDEHGFGMWVIEERGGSEPLGLCGLVRRDFLEHDDLGYALLPSGRGRGLAKEAAAACMRYAFEQLGHERLLAIVSPGNAASIRILEDLGFCRESVSLHFGADDPVLVFCADREAFEARE